jgi:transcription elongation GreA/GreB family factor
VPKGQVGFGSRVRFRLNGADREISIVGSDEADPAAGLVAFTSPLAAALMQGEAGERLDFQGKAEAIEIIGID